MTKLSIVVPVYFNEDNLQALYEDLKEKVFSVGLFDYELVMVDDGSGDNSWNVMKELHKIDSHIKLVRLSRNFGSHAAILCGLAECSGDCAVVKAADLQEPSELILEMLRTWQQGNNVVLAVRADRQDAKRDKAMAGGYYSLVRRFALPTMPKNGFDVFLLDRKVIHVLESLDEKNSAITGQILWSGFKTAQVPYVRLKREVGASRWTLGKKVRLVLDTLFSFSNLPITAVLIIGSICAVGSVVWAIFIVVMRLWGKIQEVGWSSMFAFQLFSFGVTMLTLGILGEYLWRTFDAARNRPVYIVDEVVEAESENVVGKTSQD